MENKTTSTIEIQKAVKKSVNKVIKNTKVGIIGSIKLTLLLRNQRRQNEKQKKKISM